MGIQAASWSTAAIVKTLRDEKIDDELSAITVPTLIVHGIHDQVIPFSQAELLNNKIKGSKVVPFEYSGHGLFWEERKKFNKELIDFTS
jgi:non-heme chloroperoxidase